MVHFQAAGQQAVGDLLRGHRERAVVRPLPLDVQVALPHPFVPQAQLLHHPQGRQVLRPDVHLDAVQAEHAEAVVGGHRHRGRRDAPAGDVLRDPVADRRRAQRAVDDGRDGELPDQLAGVLDAERQRRPVPPLRGQGPDELAERGPRPGQRHRARRVPGFEPRRVGAAQREPGVRVRAVQRPQPHGTLGEHRGPPCRHQPSSTRQCTTWPARTDDSRSPTTASASAWARSVMPGAAGLPSTVAR